MSDTFNAIQAIQNEEAVDVQLRTISKDSLSEGNVVVDVAFSTINFKDGLALEGNKGKVMRKFPMIPGIDFSGTVAESDDSNFSPGDEVILTGWGLGEFHTGGLSQVARVQGDWLVKKPKELSLLDSMAIGTAGFTAMLCLLTLEKHGVLPSSGPVLVTGSSGGVGSISVSLLSNIGYEVEALTRKPEMHAYLQELGASAVISSDQLEEPGKIMASEKWAGVIDTVGGDILGRIIPSVKYWGCIASCGNTAGIKFSSNVLPFILRGISLSGVESAYCPIQMRTHAWDRLSKDLPQNSLQQITQKVHMGEVFEVASKILAGNIRGRTVVDVNKTAT